MNVKEELIKNTDVTEQDFDTHESDLYVVHTFWVERWLRKYYRFWNNVTTFISDGTLWYDIPFANNNWLENKTRQSIGSQLKKRKL